MAGLENLTFEKEFKESLYRFNKLQRKEGLHIIWWNVAWGRYNKTRDLDKNLYEISNAQRAPDIIILGEYKPSVLAYSFRVYLNETYSYRRFIKYSDNSDVGIMIFSKYEIYNEHQFNLPWHPIKIKNLESINKYRKRWLETNKKDVKYWDRSYYDFTIFYKGKNVTISPIHLLMPWQAYYNKFGASGAFSRLMFKNNHPLGNQIKWLKYYLNNLYGNRLQSSSLLILGDFNLPSTFFGIKPFIFKNLLNNLSYVHSMGGDTFPAKSTLRDNTVLRGKSFEIDYALINKHLKSLGSTVMPLSGSDHYPLYVVIN